jgi:putative two-component system response regulator
VDDQEDILAIISGALRRPGWNLTTAARAEDALEIFEREPPDLVLLDLQMPGMGGIELLRRIRQHPDGGLLRVIVVTGAGDPALTMEALDAGADEILRKPFDIAELRVRVRNALDQKRLIDQLDRAENVIFALAKMVEARDGGTGDHCDRLAEACERFGQKLDLESAEIEALRRGAFLHDIGKIAIPDAVLLAPRRLTDGEWEVMKTHTVRGESICRGLHAAEAALPVVRSHHERWDGSGYPDGLAREHIPRLARIFHIVDVFDALTSKRPYKEPFSTEKAIDIMREEEQKDWYEPGLLDEWVDTVGGLSKEESGTKG